MPFTDHVALVSLTSDISTRALLLATAALQKQLTRDFLPIWGLPATIDAFLDLESVPSDYHPVVVFGGSEELAGRLEAMIGEERAAQLLAEFDADRLAGLHLNAFTRQPFSLVEASDLWTVVASHEMLEMVTNAFGNRIRAASHPLDSSVRVNYLVEVCDPCLGIWYPSNGIPVADFYTPRYFDPVGAYPSRYSFTGEIEHPLQILPGGYLSWIDPRNSAVYYLAAESEEPQRLFGVAELASSAAPLRTLVDHDPRTPPLSVSDFRPARTAAAAPGAREAMLDASQAGGLFTAQALWSLSQEH
jgi:hypothetical protein